MASIAAPASTHSERRARKPDFVARTILGVSAAIEQTIFTEEHARRPGLLQRADPRAKLALFLATALVAGLAHSIWLLLALYVLAVTLARLSNLPFSLLVKRALLGVPLFAGIVSIPALFLIAGPTAIPLPALGPVDLSISSTALWSVATFIARVATSVSFAILLVVTTRWADLLKALRVLRVPEVFVVVLGMTYRYIFLFLRAVENLFLARASRTVGETTEGERRRWVGAAAGTMLSRSMKMSNDVYQAMVARGFSGNVRTLTTFSMRDEDWLLLSSGAVILAVALMIDVGLS